MTLSYKDVQEDPTVTVVAADGEEKQINSAKLSADQILQQIFAFDGQFRPRAASGSDWLDEKLAGGN
eukprot:CAMPEP_0175096146 /NCGR_PEP_ID=MMETSP0086_2-20121207/4569_1 /TAXON_ID=136419 /ORGANISM="Unknown Unknown, Strain D1" /LENGTH=66 /DNA_ID=CAMNT_0016369513 /DNA_START=244 /DNA_END=444 /DNA_ORIENTATION=+